MSNVATKSYVALQKYTRAKDALDTHILQNKQLFDAHQQFVMKVIDAENELRDAVDEERTPVEDGAYKVLIIPQSQTFGDIEEIDKLVASGKLTLADREAVVKTIERPPHVSIKKIQE